jgi:predicted DCC family thiol-disulfide oxidoreductase YuxK
MPGWVPWAARALAGTAIIYAAIAAASGAAPIPWASLPGVVPLLALAADPGWIPPAGGGTAILFYDGTCGLCHRAVRFVLAEDRQGSIRFAPLGSPAFRRSVPEHARPALPDSLVVWSAGGTIRVRSEAVLYLADRLGGWWRALAVLGRLIPRPARDALYDGIARVRKRLFAAPAGECPVGAPHLGPRFLG